MAELSPWLQALCWGLFSGASLLFGSSVGYYVPLGKRIPSLIMAFGSGALLSSISFDLMPAAYHHGGILSTSLGFVVGGLIYTLTDFLLSHKGASHRKRSGGLQKSETEHQGSGMALAAGALIDGIPESIVLGLGLIANNEIRIVTLVAILISNVPEALSSTVGMKKSGRSFVYIFSLWFIITMISGLSSLAGFTLFNDCPPELISIITALAAGCMLTMVADTMIPEAYSEVNSRAGLAMLAGFLLTFYLGKI
jgi:ZIP family zinc transporter